MSLLLLGASAEPLASNHHVIQEFSEGSAGSVLTRNSLCHIARRISQVNRGCVIILIACAQQDGMDFSSAHCFSCLAITGGSVDGDSDSTPDGQAGVLVVLRCSDCLNSKFTGSSKQLSFSD